MVTKKTLIIGGGIAGITAAQKISQAGFEAVIVEKNSELGGNARSLTATFPELDDAQKLLKTELDAVTADNKITVYTGATITKVAGQIGNFTVEISTSGGIKSENVAAIIVATGFNYFDPTVYTEYGYGRLENVVTSLEFEKMLAEGKMPAQGAPVVVFVHCVGSRDKAKGYRFCSKICCTYSAKHAIMLKKKYPDANGFVFYIDIRALGKGYEEFIRDAMEIYGARYIRGRVAKVLERQGKLLVRAEDSLIGNPVELEADLVVLASAMEPNPDAKALAELLKVETDEYGFFKEAQSNTHPANSSRQGIFLAGSCTAPMEIANAVALAGAAAAEAIIIMAGE